jgi:tetratricopeptide (TPR) repeat protein
MKLIRNIAFIVLATLATSGYGQNFTAKAYEFYQAKQFDSAKVWLDSAIVSNERFNSQTWQLRGLVYRKLESAENANYRDISIESFVQARNVDTTNKYSEKIDGYLYNTVIRYYNDAVTSLDAGNLDASESAYVLYKDKYKKYIDSKSDFKKNDIEYYNALGGSYLRLVSQLEGEEKAKNTAKGVHFFEIVLKHDPNQFMPNFNVGIMYYNQGADLIMNMDPLTPLEEIPVIEAEAQKGFENALPFLVHANELDPTRTDVIEAITGCYYGLWGSENEDYIKYQTMLDEKNLPALLEKYNSDPENKKVVRELVRIYSTTLKDEEQYKTYSEILNKLEE